MQFRLWQCFQAQGSRIPGGGCKIFRAVKAKIVKNTRNKSTNIVSVDQGPECYIQHSCHQIQSSVGMPCVKKV
jgi:hypothetical protein